MLKPEGSVIVEVRRSARCAGCNKAGVMVTLRRTTASRVTQVECWTHDDGSFVEWLGESEQ